ncbi:hypothetical protein MNBD_GAMMA15-2372 [hydrothermal vent metagenome]|uniref:DUF1022 domain-containing protein n=1 Tax=hydrothermal vent metagenome TaxID=652676 RepID=A0A3B0YHZ9_9ZZZZ
MDNTNSKRTPLIWLVIGDKPGDNAQIDIIVKGLGLPYKIKRLIPKPEFVLGKPHFCPSLDHLDLPRSDKLEPPWPDFIITIGRRPSMAALWVQEQSGGHSKIILLGRPKKWIERFALVIAPCQYQLPPRDNVLQLNLPLMRSSDIAIREAQEAWKPRFAGLDKPVTALLVGGQTKPYRFDSKTARTLMQQSLALTEKNGGTLYITTSRRTSPEVTETLKNGAPDNAIFYPWTPDDAGNNPYHALLGLADRFIVTGDSISMMIEVARQKKPLAIFPLPLQNNPLLRLKHRLQQSEKGLTGQLRNWLNQSGLAGYSRDLGAIHRTLYEQKLAVPLGQPFLETGGTAPDEAEHVVERVRQVLLA